MVSKKAAGPHLAHLILAADVPHVQPGRTALRRPTPRVAPSAFKSVVPTPAGDTAKALAAYKDFLTLWKDADPDIPIYKQAKAEYAKLK